MKAITDSKRFLSMQKMKLFLLGLISLALIGLSLPTHSQLMMNAAVAQQVIKEDIQDVMDSNKNDHIQGLLGDAGELALLNFSDIERMTQENGVRNTSFIVLVFLLVSIVGWILTSFPKQIAKDRQFYIDEVKEQRKADKEERALDRELYDSQMSRILDAFENRISALMNDVSSRMHGCPYNKKD